MIQRFRYSGFILVLLFAGLSGFSDLNAQSRMFIHHTTRDGLISGFVWDMMQDSKGYIWIGTNAGLSRFDGYEFTNFLPTPNNPGSLSGQLIRSIHEMDDGRFIVASESAVDLFDTEKEIAKKIYVPDSLPDLNGLVDIVLMENGDLWAATSNGLYHIPAGSIGMDTVQARFFAMEHDSTYEQQVDYYSMEFDGDSSLWIGSNIHIHQFDLKNLRFVDPGPFSQDVEEVLKDRIWEIHKASNGDLLFSSRNGLVRWQSGRREPEVVKHLGPYNEKQLAEAGFQSITEDGEGKIWLGTGTLGAIHWDLETDDVKVFRNDPADPNSINSDDVHFAFTDNQQNTWFGYHVMGISMMHSINWNYRYKLALDSAGIEEPVNNLFGFAEDPAGNLYLTSEEGLIFNPVDGGKDIFYRLPEALKEDGGLGWPILRNDHILFVSQEGNRVFTFNLASKRFNHVAGLDDLGLIPMPPAENDSNYYFSGLNGKIAVVNKQDYSARLIEVPFGSVAEAEMKPALIFIDSEGNYLVQRYLIRPGNFDWRSFLFDPATMELEEVELDLPENTAMISPPNVSRNEPGVVWLRLNSGILKQNLLTAETELLFQSDVGLVNEGSGYIHEDTEGYLWMNNQTGIMKLDPVTQTIINYEIIQDPRYVWLDWVDELSTGEFIFLGKGGYIRFAPEDLDQENPIQKIYITDLYVGDRKLEDFKKEEQIRVGHSDNNLAFTFIGLNYRDPLYTRYRYRLGGYEDEWIMVGTQRRIFLANLPPGKYNFQVQAATRFGPFSENMASVSFRILPPWWRTLPAYFIYGLMAIGGVVTFDRIQRRRLIARERERTREKELEQAREIEKAYNELKDTQNQLIQSEKMASLGELTAGIAHEIQNPLNFVNNFSEVNVELVNELKDGPLGKLPEPEKEEVYEILNDLEQNLEKVSFHGKRADSIVKNMLLHSRSSTGTREPTDINALADEYLRLSYHGMRARDKSFNAKFSLEPDKNLPEIKVITQDIGRVMLNMINNAFYAVMKRSKKGIEGYMPEVIVSTGKCDEGIEIRIKDNGEGIPEQVRDKILQPFFTTKPAGEGTGLGLSISYEIITKGHGGDMKVVSVSDENHTSRDTGTEFIIYLPIKTT